MTLLVPRHKFLGPATFPAAREQCDQLNAQVIRIENSTMNRIFMKEIRKMAKDAVFRNGETRMGYIFSQ